jgi:hypothetical protein
MTLSREGGALGPEREVTNYFETVGFIFTRAPPETLFRIAPHTKPHSSRYNDPPPCAYSAYARQQRPPDSLAAIMSECTKESAITSQSIISPTATTIFIEF